MLVSRKIFAIFIHNIFMVIFFALFFCEFGKIKLFGQL